MATNLMVMKDQLKPHLKAYLQAKGVTVHPNNSFSCFNKHKHTNNDKTPSASVFTDDGGMPKWYCNRCHERGDILDAAVYLDHVSPQDFAGQIAAVATTLGIQFAEEDVEVLAQHTPRASKTYQLLRDMNRFIADFLKTHGNGIDNLMNGAFGRTYSQDEAQRICDVVSFGVVDNRELASALRETFLDSISECPYFNEHGYLDGYVFAKDRLTFPLYDERGDIVAFGGRKSKEREAIDGKQMKYKYTSGFTKTAKPFLLHAAYDDIITSHKVHVVEGQFDALTMWAKGIKNTVAVMGSAINRSHVETFINTLHVNEIILTFDADGAGVDATKKAFEAIKGFAVQLSVIELPEGEDPDSCLMKGITEPFLKPKDAMLYLFDKTPEFNDPNIPELVRIKNMVEFVCNVTNQKYRLRKYSNAIAEKCCLNASDIFTEIENHLRDGVTNIRFIDKLMDGLEDAKYRSPMEFKYALEKASTACSELLSSVANTAATYTWDYFMNLVRNGENLPPILSTGLDLLDKHARIMCGNLTVWGGRPSNGKSTFIRWLVLKRLLKHNPNLNCMYLSMDDDTTSTLITMLSMYMGVQRDDVERYVREGSFETMHEYTKGGFDKKIKELFTGRLSIFGIDECPTIPSIRKKFDELLLAHPNKQWIIVVDAVNDLREIKRADDQRMAIEASYSEFTELARSSGASVHLVNHLTKADPTLHTVKRPDLGDLKGSSAIEHDARTIFLVHMDMHYNKETKMSHLYNGEYLPYIEVKVAKDKSRPANEWIPYQFFPSIGECVELHGTDYDQYKLNLNLAISGRNHG